MNAIMKIFFNYNDEVKYFSHQRFNKLVNSLIIDDNNIYHYHNLKILDHLYNKKLNDVKFYLKNSFPNINFIFCNQNNFNYYKLSLSLDKIYIIYNSLELITDIIGIDIRPKYPYINNLKN
jgi:hypothetical protein